MPSVQVLVDQAVAKAISQSASDKDVYRQFSLDLLAALHGSSGPVEGEIELRPLSDEIVPQHRRLLAWALMRYLGARGAFPSEPSDLRPKALAFIQNQIGHDLQAYRIDFDSQSHEVEGALSQVVSSIELAIGEAVTFRSFDTLAQFQQTLFATINAGRNAGLLYAFSSRSLVNEALKRSLDAVRAFRDADDLSILELYRYAKNACIDVQTELRNDGTDYATRLISSVPRALEGALDAEIARLDLAQPATLSLVPIDKKYPLHAAGAEIDIRLVLHNSGGGTAFNVQISVESTNELHITRSELHLGILYPQESRSLQFTARVIRPEGIALLRADVEWANFDRRMDSFVSDLELEAQDSNIDWTELAKSQPYALDVAIGDRFVGRTSLLNKLLARVSSPNPGSLYLWGQKRVGKTSLVRALADSVSGNVDNFVVVYLETIRELTAEKTTDAICRRLISRLKAIDERFAAVTAPIYTGTLSPLNDFLDQLQLIAPERRFLIIIDEFDELPVELYKGRGVADTFFQILGQGIAGKVGVGVVIVGGERIPQIIRAQGMRLNMYRPERIDHFDRNDEFSNLVRQPGLPLEFSDNAIGQLWEYSAGNPYFLNEICSRLAEMMIERRDAYVTENEVEEAVLRTLNTIDSNSFAHYWSDGIVDLDAEQTAATITDRIRFFVAAAEVIGEGDEFISKESLTQRAGRHGSTAATVDRLLRDFQTRGILIGGERGYKFRVKLFQEWLRDRGIEELSTQLWDDLGNRERINEERAALIDEDELHELVAQWGPYQGSPVSALAVRQWLGQFGSVQDQRLMFKILQGIRFYRDDLVRAHMEQVHRIIAANFVTHIKSTREHRRDIIVSYLGPVGRSGPSMARLYRQSNRIWHDNCLDPSKIGQRLAGDANVRAVVFVDDFIGTGRTAMRHFGEFLERHKEVAELVNDHQISVWYATVAGTIDGIHELRRFFDSASVNVKVVAADELGDDTRAFSSDSPLWVDSEERDLAEEIATSYGKRLKGRAPLGFGDTQGLVVFESNCPNTSLPILHKRRKALGEAFQPLFSSKYLTSMTPRLP